MVLYYTEETWSIVMVVGDNKINDEDNAGKLLTILMALAMQWYDAVHIAQQACAGLPWRLPRLLVSNGTQKH
jgi:hypothetical protein